MTREVSERILLISYNTFNARSILNKLDELILRCSVNKPKIIAITETCLNSDITDNLIHIDGYKIIRNDRLDRRVGGRAPQNNILK